MIIIKIINKYILKTIIICIILFPIISFASEGDPINILESVIIEKSSDDKVIVPYNRYKIALRYKDNYYDFLSNGNGFMKLIGISSGEKFIEYTNYKIYLRYSPSMSEAIENAPTVAQEESSTYKSIESYEYDIEEIKIGQIPGEIVGNNIYFSFPINILDNSINNVSIKFTSPIKIDKVNDLNLGEIIIKKLRASGYNEELCYNSYEIPLGKIWKYSHIIDATSSRGEKITVVNEHGLVKEFYIYFKIAN